MQSINFQGLNCYHNCIVSIANYLGIDYSCAFYNLWSETDFRYEIYRKVYLTRRLIDNFEALGLRLERMLTTIPEQAAAHLSTFCEGEFIIVGMDAFYIPWNQFYQTFHGPHYFVARNERSAEFLCFDPTYDRQGDRIPAENVINHSFDLSHLHSVAKRPPILALKREASEVIENHGATRQRILAQIENCGSAEPESIILLAKYVDTMISNRYLFEHYLAKKRPLHSAQHQLFDGEFFSKWTAVKNGLYKLSVKKNNIATIQEVSSLFNLIIDKEISMVEDILSGL